MTFVLADRVRETSDTSGTGAIHVTGQAAGYQTFAAVLSDGDITMCAAADGTGNWQSFLGTWDAGASTLTRTYVYDGSSGHGVAVSFSGSDQYVWISDTAFRGDPGILNAKMFGAALDGTTSDQASMTSLFAATPALSRINVGPGNINWGSFNPTSKQVFWQLSGNYSGSGTTELTAIGNNVFQSYLATGGVYFARGSTTGMSTLGGVMRVDMTVNHAGGTAGGLSAFEVNIANTAASTPGQELIGATFRATSNRTGTTARTATAMFANARKTAGNTQPFGANISAEDATYVSGSNAGNSGDNGSAVGAEFNVKANGLDDGLLADGFNSSAEPQAGASRIGIDVKVGRYDRTDSNVVEFSNLLNFGPVDTDTSWIYAKNVIASRMQVSFAGLNFRQTTFGTSANGVLFQVGDNSTIAWTADSTSATPTNYTTIKGTGSAGNLGLELTALGAAAIKTAGGRVRANRVVTAAGAVTVTKADDTVVVNKTVGAATTVNLPASPVAGQRHTIKDGKGDAAANNITITPAAGNVDGAGTLVLSSNYGYAVVEYNGTEWNRVG